MRIIVIGAVAAGTSAAAKARRNCEDTAIVIYEKDRDISYSGCGMPYYLGGEVGDVEELTPREPSFFWEKHRVAVHILHEVLAIHREEKRVEVKNLETGEIFFDTYDKLIVATGAYPVVPPIRGVERDHVFVLRTIEHVRRIQTFLEEKKPNHALIVGTGFIGLEVCENLTRLGIAVTLVDRLSQVTPGLDKDMAVYVAEHLKERGVTVYTGCNVEEILEDAVRLSNQALLKTDFVLLATGVRPDVELAKKAGLTLGETGAIAVDDYLQTSDPHIFACGDCIETPHRITKKAVYRPLGSTANKTGRVAGENVTGGSIPFEGVLGTGIFRVFGLCVAQTGLTESEAERAGYKVQVCHNIKPDKPEYMGGKELIIKGVADEETGRLLGVQILGPEGVDKRVDVFATALSFQAHVKDLIHLDLAYAPPFSTSKDPVMYTGMILDNAIKKKRPLMTPEALLKKIRQGEDCQIVDARVSAQYEKGHVPTAISAPHGHLREEVSNLDKNLPTITYCNKGVTGNSAQGVLLNQGFKEVWNLSGGHRHFQHMNQKGKTSTPSDTLEEVLAQEHPKAFSQDVHEKNNEKDRGK